MAGSVQASPTFSLTPTPSQTVLASNYITDFDFLRTELPDVYEDQFERYGKRTVAGFLRLTGAEYPTISDMIKWTEQGRLHTKYTGATIGAMDTPTTNQQVFTVAGGHNFRVNQTVFLSSENVSSESAKGIIVAVTATTFTVAYYENLSPTNPFAGSTTVTAFVYGSEFTKGANGMQGSLDAEVNFFEEKPIIIKDFYNVSGSDVAQLGWVRVQTEAGSGYAWFMQSEHETRQRFEDYMEMSMIEAEPAEGSSGAEAFLASGATAAAAGGPYNAGTRGLFYKIKNDGNVWAGGNPTTLTDYDNILKRLDKQGSIQENVIFGDRDMCLDLDDMLAAQNSHGAGGTSYGLFDNDEQMALNLGFDGFKRGGYEFYKTDWKYLNDATLRGGLTGGNVNGVMVPAGSMNVYDQVMGENVSRPYLHVRYRETERESRRYKTWITGSVGGAQTSDLDAMEVNFLTERSLCTMGANNFFIFED